MDMVPGLTDQQVERARADARKARAAATVAALRPPAAASAVVSPDAGGDAVFG